MKILLTGANGFVGSHILDSLQVRGIATAIVLRPDSNRRLIESHLPHVTVRTGSLNDPDSLGAAMQDVTHLIHCAGCTKALRASEFYEVNQTGTRHVVEAVNRQSERIQRLVHISSLAAGGPASQARPAGEDDPPHPVSDYGRSKLAGEEEVRKACKPDYVILRPPAVYGPRDTGFLPLFKAVQNHVLPRFGGGRQQLSLVFAKDLAEIAVTCLTHPAAAGKTFYTASPEVTTTLYANGRNRAPNGNVDAAAPVANGGAVAAVLFPGSRFAADRQAERAKPAEVRRAARAGLGM